MLAVAMLLPSLPPSHKATQKLVPALPDACLQLASANLCLPARLPATAWMHTRCACCVA
jgi:hypothetical protein